MPGKFNYVILFDSQVRIATHEASNFVSICFDCIHFGEKDIITKGKKYLVMYRIKKATEYLWCIKCSKEG